MKKVVTFRAASLGDTLLAKYLFENLRSEYIDARCIIVTGARSAMLRELLHDYHWVEIKEINRCHPIEIIKGFFDLRGADLVVIPTSYGVFSTPSKIFARLISVTGALWGYNDGSYLASLLYDRIFEINHDRPVIENELEIVRSLKINPSLLKPTFHINKPDENVIKKIGLEKNKYLVINIFSGSPNRGLSPKNRQRLIDVIVKNTSEYELILVGGMQNRSDLESLALPPRAKIITGSITELLQLLYFSKAVVSVDTGVAHISSGLGKTLLVLSSYAGRGWWTKVQHPDTTTALVGQKGSNEEGNKAELFPESLNNFTNNDIERWVASL